MNATPLHISLLIHYHCFHGPPPFREAPAVFEYSEELRSLGFIYPDESRASGFVTSIKGRHAMMMMIDTMKFVAEMPLDSTPDLPGISQEVAR